MQSIMDYMNANGLAPNNSASKNQIHGKSTKKNWLLRHAKKYGCIGRICLYYKTCDTINVITKKESKITTNPPEKNVKIAAGMKQNWIKRRQLNEIHRTTDNNGLL